MVELKQYAEDIAQIYSKGGKPDTNGYKDLIGRAMSKVTHLESTMTSSGENSTEVLLEIM